MPSDGCGTAAACRANCRNNNPQRTKTFSLSDWKFVCDHAAGFFAFHAATGISAWLADAAKNPDPKKSDQDRLDACLCLLVALLLQQGRECLMVGDLRSGYIVAPYDPALLTELAVRCMKTGRAPMEWVRAFHIPAHAVGGESAAPAPPRVSAHQTGSRTAKIAWTLPKIAALLDRRRQRATYGAVAGILGVLPRGVMNGHSKSPEYSWIVAASGSGRGRPTGYADRQIHPECLRQIRENRGRVITGPEELRDWLQHSA